VPQLRQNIITGEWVVIAPDRAKRPTDYVTADTVKVQSKTNCKFCVDRPAYNERIKKLDTPIFMLLRINIRFFWKQMIIARQNQ
jgi:galactose-1-phosphate uridylyltransferase